MFVRSHCNSLVLNFAGEIQQLQWELKNRDAERESLSSQLSILTAKTEEQEQLLASLSDLQTQYDALLQLYGENLEQNQELRMDLQDVKEMYKAQVKIINTLFSLWFQSFLEFNQWTLRKLQNSLLVMTELTKFPQGLSTICTYKDSNLIPGLGSVRF